MGNNARGTNVAQPTVVCNMAIRVVEFSNGGYNIRKVLPKNQYTPRKLLNFENWVTGGLRSFQKSEF